jgi:DNA-directed RNA polymerase beta subunit
LSQYFVRKYQCLDEDGLAKVGYSINSGDIFVNKKVPVVAPEVKDKFKVLGLSQNEVSWSD